MNIISTFRNRIIPRGYSTLLISHLFDSKHLLLNSFVNITIVSTITATATTTTTITDIPTSILHDITVNPAAIKTRVFPL